MAYAIRHPAHVLASIFGFQVACFDVGLACLIYMAYAIRHPAMV